ncbi:pyruvate dehydrogenase E2 component (dihydrolipoamide acetyltransferase) [Agreia bicolorata]|uniref:Dihydrolipoamide acetyltransferase component of pyruvate dehydrogenase complex n=1 Tax=Agreia bicolorata TaxID=110935 RepID=A0A1T4Y3C2_9MICO|nr:dihydrolipoamide acetyltransferase family protein [Agreia bicolorata]SKA95775.1 pyruvate dehydrogenase E2 component (dihydrolipoamide acetyltransferase) [Agreia bicolorata]
MTTSHFNLPDVGEGLTEAEIVSWRVAPGDTVAINDVLVEIETAKSLVELPSPFEGVVEGLLVAEGDTVDVGTPIISVTSAGGAAVAPAPVPGFETPITAAAASPGHAAPAPAAAPSAHHVAPASASSPAVVEAEQVRADAAASVSQESDSSSGAVLVGYGIKGHVASRRPSRSGAGAAAAKPNAASTGAASSGQPQASGARAARVPVLTGLPIIAKPPIRKLAKDLGVNLAEVQPTGPIGDITRDDVVRHAEQAKVFHNIETPQWADTREEIIPVKGVRKQIAKAMTHSAFSAPHVSLFVDVDATRTMEFVKRLKTSTDFTGVKVSPLLIMARAMIWAVRRNPMVNSAWTDKEIIVRNYVNLGIAAATPRGLIVPNVKDAQDMSLLELAAALEQLTLTAREGRTSPADQANGTITLTNIGVFGMDTGTPILNPGEVAIVALGTIKQKPWVVDGEVRPRFVTTVGASFDHRVVDGDVASRFLADVASIMEEPALLLD